MWPDRVSNPGPPTYESGALPIALRGPADVVQMSMRRNDVASTSVRRHLDVMCPLGLSCNSLKMLFTMNNW